jgi:rhodanese-related sulfurtransferase
MIINSSKFALMIVAILLSMGSLVIAANRVPRIDLNTLKNWLANPGVKVIDVRDDIDWETSAMKIKGAVREDPDNVAAWMKALPKDKKIVLYCA